MEKRKKAKSVTFLESPTLQKDEANVIVIEPRSCSITETIVKNTSIYKLFKNNGIDFYKLRYEDSTKECKLYIFYSVESMYESCHSFLLNGNKFYGRVVISEAEFLVEGIIFKRSNFKNTFNPSKEIFMDTMIDKKICFLGNDKDVDNRESCIYI